MTVFPFRFILASESSISETNVKIHVLDLSNFTNVWVTHPTNIEITRSGKLVMFKGNLIYLSYPKPKLLTGFILEGNFSTWHSIGPNETENFTKEEDALCPIEFWNQRISAITHNSIL